MSIADDAGLLRVRHTTNQRTGAPLTLATIAQKQSRSGWTLKCHDERLNQLATCPTPTYRARVAMF
jgi:hypothetical protein